MIIISRYADPTACWALMSSKLHAFGLQQALLLLPLNDYSHGLKSSGWYLLSDFLRIVKPPPEPENT